MPGVWSRRQAELFIARQSALLQNNENAALSPPELQDQIRKVLLANPEHAEAVSLCTTLCVCVCVCVCVHCPQDKDNWHYQSKEYV